jgi:ketosteroid isomerase-like protein
MSAHNVELVRRLFDAIARRDTANVLSFYDPDVEWDASRAAPGEAFIVGTYRGHDGLRRYFREWYEAWANIEYAVEELIDADEQVISVVTNRGRGRASGAAVDWMQYAVWTFREGKIVRVEWFPARAEALAALAGPR